MLLLRSVRRSEHTKEVKEPFLLALLDTVQKYTEAKSEKFGPVQQEIL